MDDLSELISSLTSTEKQHFKKKNSANSDFVILFDYINKNAAFNNADAISYLSKKQPDKKSFSSSYLSVVKKYLKVRIFESLRIQYIHKRKNNALLTSSINADILLEKGLFGLARKEIVNSLNSNKDSSFPIERLLLLRRKSLLEYFENYENTDLDGINALFAARLEAADQLKIEIEFAKAISVMTFMYFSGDIDQELLRSLMSKPFMQDESLSKEFGTQYLFHWVHAQYEESLNNNEAALGHFNKSIKVWIKHPKYIDTHPRMYLVACFKYFKYLIHQKEPFSSILSDIDFNLLKSKIESEKLSSGEATEYNTIFNLFEILALREQCKFGEVVELVNAVIVDTNFYRRVPPFEKVVFCYYSAQAYYSVGDLAKASDMLFDLLNPIDSRLGSNPAYFNVCILLNSIIIYEKGNEKLLKSLLPKYKKSMTKEGVLPTFEGHFLSMMSQLMSPRYQPSKELVYDRFYKRLEHLLQSDELGMKMEYGFILSWIKDRLDAAMQ